jgi:hypothetical protein
MLTIVWDPNDFQVINVLSKGIKFNINYYITEVLTPLVEWRKNQAGRTDPKLIVHVDKARLYTATVSLDYQQQNGMKSTSPIVHI